MEGDSENLEGLNLEKSLIGSIPGSDMTPGKQPQEILPETAWIEILSFFKNSKPDVFNLCSVSPYLEWVLLTRVLKKSKFDLLFGEIYPLLLSKKYIDHGDFNSCLKAKNLKWHNFWKNGTVNLICGHITVVPSTSADVIALREVIEEEEMDNAWHNMRIVFYSRGDANYWKSVSKFMENCSKRYPCYQIVLTEKEMPTPYRREHVQQIDSVDYTMFLESLKMNDLLVHVAYLGQKPQKIMSSSRYLKNGTTGPDGQNILSYRTDFLFSEDNFLQVVRKEIDELIIDPPPDGIPEHIVLFNQSFEKLKTITLRLRMTPLELQAFCNALPDLSDRNDLNVDKLWLLYHPSFDHGTYIRLCNKFSSASKLTISTHIDPNVVQDQDVPQGNAEMEGLRNETIVEVKFFIYSGDWVPHINHIQTFLLRLVNVKEITVHFVALDGAELIDFVTGKENDFWDYLPNGKVVNFTNLPMYPRNPKYEGLKYELVDRNGGEFNTIMTRYSDIYY